MPVLGALDDHNGGPARPERSASRRIAIAVALACFAVVVAVAVVVVVGVSQRGGDDHVGDAIVIASSEDGYGTGLEAGRTLARTASALNRAIRACDRTVEPERCSALGAASGYVQVTAATVVHCTAPGRVEARRSVRSVLEDVRSVGPGDPAPALPPVARCR